MLIKEARQLRSGDRVTWTPDLPGGDPVSHGKVEGTSMLGVTILYDDGQEVDYPFRLEEFFRKLSRAKRKAA